MKISSATAQPRRSSWKRRVAFWSAALALGGGLVAISRGELSRFELFPASQPLPPQNPALQAKRNLSVSKALAKLDAKVIQAYFERYSNPEKSAIGSARRAVYIDAETLARRHPAWLLATRLESGAISPSNPQISRVLIPSRNSSPQRSDLAATRSLFPDSRAPDAIRGVVLSDSASQFFSAAPQNRALNRFLSQSAARDSARARDEAALSRQALEDETARAARLRVSELDLATLPPEVALELLNLRLELLPKLSRTFGQRAAARERIRSIEARYAEVLRDQDLAQAARLRAAAIDAPARARREGLVQIERARQNSLGRAAAARRQAARETQTLLRRDAAQNSVLRLNLPPLRPLRIPRAASAEAARSNGREPQFLETAGVPRASKAPLEEASREEAARGSDARRALMLALRRKARSDSAQWARESAAYLGARWSRDPALPDATARALELVFPSRP